MQHPTEMAVSKADSDMPSEGSAAAAIQNGQAVASNTGEDTWDEERIEQALKTLKEMHIQVSCDSIYLGHCFDPSSDLSLTH